MVSSDVFLSGLVLGHYIVLGLTWDFNMTDRSIKINVMRLFFTWLLVWLSPLFIQTSILIAGELGRAAEIITLLETFYTVSIWVGVVISAYFAIYITYTILLWFGGVMENSK